MRSKQTKERRFPGVARKVDGGYVSDLADVGKMLRLAHAGPGRSVGWITLGGARSAGFGGCRAPGRRVEIAPGREGAQVGRGDRRGNGRPCRSRARRPTLKMLGFLGRYSVFRERAEIASTYTGRSALFARKMERAGERTCGNALEIGDWRLEIGEDCRKSFCAFAEHMRSTPCMFLR